MKTNLKLSKITISKLDNLNFKPLEKGELKNVKGGADVLNFTNTSQPPTHPTDPTRPTSGDPIDIIGIGGGYNDTTHLSSCQIDYNVNYTDCISRDS